MTTNLIRFLALAISVLAAVPTLAQAADCTLSGAVTSPTGSRIATAHLSIKNIANGDTNSVTVERDGSYLIRNLLPGTYEITVSAPGFADGHTTVAISADGKPVVNLVLQTRRTREAGKGQVGSSTVKGDVTTSVSELPLNGRSASDVAALEPGVATTRTQASGQAQRGFGTEMTISGGRPGRTTPDSTVSASTTTPMAHQAAPWASIWEWMRWSNSQCLPATTPRSTAVPLAASLVRQLVRGRTRFTGRSMSSFGTACWTLGISLILRSRRSTAINSELRSERLFSRIGLSFLVITRVYARPWV